MIKEACVCRECAEKPGTPTLCGPCFHNREAIASLNKKVAVLTQLITVIESVSKLRKEVV